MTGPGREAEAAGRPALLLFGVGFLRVSRFFFRGSFKGIHRGFSRDLEGLGLVLIGFVSECRFSVWNCRPWVV